MGDTLFTDQRTMTVLPVIADPLRLLKSSYTSEIGGTIDIPTWTLIRESFGLIDTLLKNVPNFSYGHDTARIVDGMILHHFDYRDSGMIPDKGSVIQPGKSSYRNGWDYETAQNLWFEGPDTTAVKTAKMITSRQYQSRSTGMSFPTIGTFRNSAGPLEFTARTLCYGYDLAEFARELEQLHTRYDGSAKFLNHVESFELSLTLADKGHGILAVIARYEHDTDCMSPVELRCFRLEQSYLSGLLSDIRRFLAESGVSTTHPFEHAPSA